MLARVLPLAVACKHADSPNQNHQLPGSNRDMLFPFEYAGRRFFLSTVV